MELYLLKETTGFWAFATISSLRSISEKGGSTFKQNAKPLSSLPSPVIRRRNMSPEYRRQYARFDNCGVASFWLLALPGG